MASVGQALFLLQSPLLLHSEGPWWIFPKWTVSTALQMSTDWPCDPATPLPGCEQTENKSSDKGLNTNVPRSHLCYIFRCCNKMPGPKKFIVDGCLCDSWFWRLGIPGAQSQHLLHIWLKVCVGSWCGEVGQVCQLRSFFLFIYSHKGCYEPSPFSTNDFPKAYLLRPSAHMCFSHHCGQITGGNNLREVSYWAHGLR